MKIDNLSIPPVQGQMDRHRWETVNRIFHSALEIDSSGREVFVRSASESDPEIYAEVMALLRADENVGSYLETPLLQESASAFFESPVKAGDVLCERFQILRAIAEGGMGHVFEAHDTELNVRVALKVIRPEIASVPEALARFRQEVRLARTITHPNVCRTFDINRETRVLEPETGSKLDVVFLTMELLPGETLASRVKRSGALPIEEAFLLARQIGDALHAAHTLGIIHRDIKPSNIMLVPTESASPESKYRAVITDFGLARLNPVLPVGNVSSLSHTARPVGTLAYMAPEQLDGAPVSAATDNYAFGLILFEMVTGARAFPSENLLTGLSQRLTGPPPSPKSLVPRLPDNWCYVIDRCLQVNPSERPQDASEVAAMLGDNRAHRSSAHGRSFLGFSSLFNSFRRTFAVVATTICICVALFAAGFRFYQSRVNSKVTPGALIYLTQVKNQTGDKALDNLTELIQAGLTQSAHINLLDQDRVGETLENMAKAPDTKIDPTIAREIAMRTGAVRVVFATVTGTADSYSLNIDIQQPDASDPSHFLDHWPKSFPWHRSSLTTASISIPPEILTAIRASSSWIRLEAGESANDVARLDAPPQDVTTANWQALAEYTNAERLNALRQQDDAVIALQNAVRSDPQFALAYARLGDILLSLNRSVEGYRAYSMALTAGDQRRLSRRERDRIRGIYALDTGDFQTAEQVFHDFSVYYENDYLGWFYRAAALMMLDRTPEAATNLERAISLQPSGSSAPYTLAFFEYMLHNDAAARHWAMYLRQNSHPDEANLLEAEDSFINNRFDEAESKLRLLQSAHEELLRSVSYSYLSHLAADRGNFQRAIDFLTDGIAADQSTGSTAERAVKQMDRAFIECNLQQFQRCIDDEQSAIALNPSFTTYRAASTLLGESIPTAPAPILGKMRGLLTANERQMSKEDIGPVSEITRAEMRGEILLSEGHSAAALSQFRKAAVLDAPADPKEYLAHALVLVAEGERDPRLRASLLNEAAPYYRRIALQPAYIWYSTSRYLYPPGYWADGMATWLRIASNHNQPDGSFGQVLKELATLRPQGITQPPDFTKSPNQRVR
jgi:eukaryotic-like serine/threonine-protein kinase